MQLSEKLSLLRQKMDETGVHACIIPSGDPHLSEYPATHWKIREWVSGFTGSAGTLVVTTNYAGLWTDSRYYLQASEQLDASYIQLHKEGLSDVPDIPDWLLQNLEDGQKVGINSALFSDNYGQNLLNRLKNKSISLEQDFKAPEEIWENRPQLPDNEIIIMPDDLTGFSTAEKINQVREEMKKVSVNYYITVSLDEIAWVLNLRGTDVLYNPVFYAYLVISLDDVTLFVEAKKLSDNVINKLSNDKINIQNYENFYSFLEKIHENSEILIDSKRTNMAVINSISKKCKIKKEDSIITNLKAIKNETEIENIRKTMIEDGIAMVNFLSWLSNIKEYEKHTELSVSQKLTEFRKERNGFMGESFETISSYGEHGAIVHYSATPETDIPLKHNGIYLADSGGQYNTGTTDITRTIALGDVPEQAKIDYTLVLKGHIALAQAVFPAGTRGAQLDVLARIALWKHGFNYGHGTGHGVGYYLNVHEGPQSIRMQENPVTLKPGMITSNEPGIYRSGEYGIRLENLILCVEKEETAFGKFLAFETLTLCPFDKNLIRRDLLTDDEIKWLNNYHKTVYDTLAPHLSSECKEWLEEEFK